MKVNPCSECQMGISAKAITRGNCVICGKELTDKLFFCNECEEKAIQQEREENENECQTM